MLLLFVCIREIRLDYVAKVEQETEGNIDEKNKRNYDSGELTAKAMKLLQIDQTVVCQN